MRHSVVCIGHHGVRSAQVVACRVPPGVDGVYNLAGGVDAGPTLVFARLLCL